MSDFIHCVVPGAGLPAREGAPPPPPLPAHLARLLRRLVRVDTVEAGADSPAMPHEIVLARLLGLPDEPGRTPWAAFETRTVGTPCAWVHPCHWQVGSDQVLLADPARLALGESDARALLQAAAPFFREDGIELAYVHPTAWLATGAPLADLSTWSLDRMVGRRLTPEMLGESVGGSPVLRRLQSEMQMLFYAHPVTDERLRVRQEPINAFWLAGAGALATLPAPAAGVVVEPRLRESARALDAAAHAQAWQAVDADRCAALLAALDAGGDVRLTLAGERRALTYASRPRGWLARLTARLAPAPTPALLESL